MYPAILGAIVVTTIFIEIQKRNIDRIFDKMEKEQNKILTDYLYVPSIENENTRKVFFNRLELLCSNMVKHLR